MGTAARWGPLRDGDRCAMGMLAAKAEAISVRRLYIGGTKGPPEFFRIA
jgi:hypothetical protein